MPGRAFGVAGGRCIRPAGGSVPGARRAADPAGRRRRLQRLLGACLIAAVVGLPSTLASAATSGLPAPTGLTAAAAGSSQISLTWTAPVAVKSASVIGYKIYAGTSPGGEAPAGSATVTSDTVSGLSSGTTYYFEVTAVYQSCIDSCSDFDSPPSNEVSATTGNPVLGAPTGLTATAAGSSRISLTWTAPVAVKGASVIGYKIYAGTSPGGEAPAGSATVASDTVSGLSSGTTYYFEVTAVYQSCIDSCSDFDSPPSNEVSATTGNPVLGAPTGLTATAAGSSRISLTWTAPTAVKGASVISYKIYAGTSPGGEAPAGSATVTSDTV